MSKALWALLFLASLGGALFALSFMSVHPDLVWWQEVGLLALSVAAVAVSVRAWDRMRRLPHVETD